MVSHAVCFILTGIGAFLLGLVTTSFTLWAGICYLVGDCAGFRHHDTGRGLWLTITSVMGVWMIAAMIVVFFCYSLIDGLWNLWVTEDGFADRRQQVRVPLSVASIATLDSDTLLHHAVDVERASTSAS